ncbi:MAG TPA: DNA-3-methyladenine glycosylase I [Balneolaceae bacterium]|nr:DNA-3-methyladenine glycosylase I [Balneolaceae bacterium]
MKRCNWAEASKAERNYHDSEWGVPSFDNRHLFEMLILEGAQAGLSWSTILNKRESYRKAFDNFDPELVARYDEKKIENLLQNPGIVRNRLKVNSAIGNARACLKMTDKYGSFSSYIWQFTNGKPVINSRKSMSEIPATTELSDKMSRQLKKDGFKFVGSTICYAFMQATGMVNDHLVDCFRYDEITE